MNEKKELTEGQKKFTLLGLILVSVFGYYNLSKFGIDFIILLWLGMSVGSIFTFTAGQNLIKDSGLKKIFLYAGLALMALSFIAISYFAFFMV